MVSAALHSAYNIAESYVRINSPAPYLQATAVCKGLVINASAAFFANLISSRDTSREPDRSFTTALAWCGAVAGQRLCHARWQNICPGT
jgi:hypothetical protein